MLGSGLRGIRCAAGYAFAVTTPPPDTVDPAVVVYAYRGGAWVVLAAGTGFMCDRIPAPIRPRFPDFC